MLLDSELLTLNLMNYSGQYCLNIKVVEAFFDYLIEEIKKRYLTFFEVDNNLDDLGYMAKYLIKNDNKIELDPHVNGEIIHNYLKVNILDDEIEAIINNFVTKWEWEKEQELILKRN